MELSRESIWTGSQWKATTFKSKGPLVIRYITHKVNAWGINHCTHKLIWMCVELFLTGDKKFKVATKLDEKLKLTCTVLQQIVNIQHQNVCADLAKGHEDANGLHYDETNKVCSIQHCNKNNISTSALPTARISIMFEDKFYPRSKFPCFSLLWMRDKWISFSPFLNVKPHPRWINECADLFLFLPLNRVTRHIDLKLLNFF